MTLLWDVVVKVEKTKRKMRGQNINTQKEIKLGTRGKHERKGKRAMPIDHDMWAMIEGDIRRERSKG